MKYKKLITMTLVTILLCTSALAATGRNMSSEEKIKDVKSTGLLRGRLSLSTFFEKIAEVFSSLFDRLRSAEPEEPQTPETPEPVKLVLEIVMDQMEFKLDEPIAVVATLTNMGERTVYVAEMDVRLGTLDFCIRTKDGYIHYMGPFVDKVPEVKVLNPNGTLVFKMIINSPDVTFGKKVSSESEEGIPKPYYFDEGCYAITGIYTSKIAVEPTPSSLTADVQVWQGELESNTLEFVIGK